MPDLVLIGAGGFGRETAALVEAINAASSTWTLRGFLDDDASLHGTTALGYPVLGPIAWLDDARDVRYSVTIGAPAVRRTLLETRLSALSARPATLVHPDVPLHENVNVGAGSILCRGTTPTVDVQIGAHVIVNLHCTIGHDARVGDFATLHPGVHLSGASVIEPGAELGTGAVVLPGRTVGAGARVGAGAVVTRDLPPHCTAVGVPARPVDRSN